MVPAVKVKKAASAPVGLGVSSAKKVSSLMDKVRPALRNTPVLMHVTWTNERWCYAG
jgi:D-aminopeptidase